MFLAITVGVDFFKFPSGISNFQENTLSQGRAVIQGLSNF